MNREEIIKLGEQLKTLVEIKDRQYGFPRKTFQQCFVGEEAVAEMVNNGMANDSEDAMRIGDLLIEAGILHHVQKAHSFKSEYLFYRFASDQDHGDIKLGTDGAKVSWSDFLPQLTSENGFSLQPNVPESDPDFAAFDQVSLSTHGVSPMDEHNSKLLDNTHPRAWKNPTPKKKYNLVAIGGGAGGLVSTSATAGMGGKAALVESHLLGGDCLNVGCVPSKALIRCARAAAEMRDCHEFGLKIKGEWEVDFSAIMERMRRLRAGISPVDSAERYAKELGVDVFLGRGKFTGPNTIEVDGSELHFAKAIVATGGTASIPPIPGLKDAPILTNANVFNLTELPKRIGVIGSGPIGLELAQSFRRFGSAVTVFCRGDRIMPKEDREAADLVQESMEKDGVQFLFNIQYEKVESSGADGPAKLYYSDSAGKKSIEIDKILVAAGRKPQVEDLGLEAAGVEFDKRTGVIVDDYLRTSNPDVFAVGDVATRYQFTHIADFMARIAIKNAMFFGRDKFSNLLIPWATYTEPEVAHVGLYEVDLEEKNIPYATYRKDFNHVDRAILEGSGKGFVKIHTKKGSDEILGATIVGPHAGDMISEITVAMKAGMGLSGLSAVIHPYPTTAEAIRQTGDVYNRTRLTPTVRSILEKVLDFRR